MISREDIYKLSRDDPAIQQAISLYNTGGCSWEQALMALVDWYSRERRVAMEMLENAKLMQPPTPFTGNKPDMD